MAELNKLTLLKANLNMLNPPAERVAMLEDTPGDVQLQVEYAAWMYKRRTLQAGAQLPEFLRLDLNDRLAHEKMRARDA